MLALVKTKKGEGALELLDRPIPTFGDDEVLIRVAYSGICGTDIHILHDQFAYYPPVILGHEFSGEVVKIGKSVTQFEVGDLVVGEPHNKACGKCYLCRNGHIQNCMDKRSIGWGIDGSFTNYLTMPEKLLHKIPAGLSLKAAALAEPTAIVAHQLLERARVTPGENVVIMGVGPIALLAAQMARVAGAGKILLCGCTADIPYRLEIAKTLNCFDRFINVQTEDAVSIIMEETEIGAELVVEASGAGSAIRTSIKVLRKWGRLCAIGMTSAPTVEIPWNEAMLKVIDVQFNMSSSYEGWNIALKLLASGKVNVDPMIGVRPLREWQTAFADLEGGKAMKLLLTPEPISE
ncbi:MAG: alcohol dehydrogenase catalytic domain-containing protein [Clostridia bacterium]|nr:alcohol dehydrogenase catalytic domain-containing protein [Clostridia bacterium]